MNDSNMFAHLTNCWYGPHLKIGSKIDYIILVKFLFTKYYLTMTGELTICGSGPRLIIV